MSSKVICQMVSSRFHFMKACLKCDEQKALNQINMAPSGASQWDSRLPPSVRSFVRLTGSSSCNNVALWQVIPACQLFFKLKMISALKT